MTKTLRVALVAAMTLALTTPGTTAFPEPFHDFTTTFGPHGMDYKHHVEGPGYCYSTAQSQMTCPPQGTGKGASGGARFDLSRWNFENPGFQTRQVRVWVEWVEGTCGILGQFCGFSITLCNDRDDNDYCTNNDPVDNDDFIRPPSAGWMPPLRPWDDQMKSQYSNPPLVGEPCKDGDPKNKDDPGKDSKDCGIPTDAEAYMCVLVDAKGTEEGPTFDDLWVFINDWQDDPLTQNPKENIGMGVSSGQYNVHLEYRDWGCEPWD